MGFGTIIEEFNPIIFLVYNHFIIFNPYYFLWEFLFPFQDFIDLLKDLKLIVNFLIIRH